MRLVILDRDGVINEDSDEFIKSPDEWRPIPGSLEAIVRLTKARYHIVVATNQSGLARGLFDLDMLTSIHDKMHRELAKIGGRIDAVYYCPHGPDDNCPCRKPRSGMFKDISKRLRTDLKGVAAIGDSLRDLQAAQAAGATPILVRTGKGAATEARGESLQGVNIFDDLAAATDFLLSA